MLTSLPDLAGFVEYGGVQVSYVDGEGDAPIALGHHDDAKAVIGAFARHSVNDCGLAGICDDPTYAAGADRPDLLARTWAVTTGDRENWVIWWQTDRHSNPITAETLGAFPVTLWCG